MTSESTGRGCVFCGGKPLTNEHVWPEWVRPYLQSPYGRGTATRVILRHGQEPQSHSHQTDPATLEVKAVCKPCNTRWMSRMETDCKPYLLSMIEGHGRTYYDEGQK